MQSAFLPHAPAWSSAFRRFGVVLGVLLVMAPAPSVRCSDAYLVRFGPPPLRFCAPILRLKDFRWPVPLVRKETVTNELDAASSQVATNQAPASKPVELAVATQTSNAEPITAEPGQEPVGFTFPPSSTASNLLLISPQMLAEYLRTNPDPNLKPGTNAVGTLDVPFNPPGPRSAPSSEAIYRTQ